MPPFSDHLLPLILCISPDFILIGYGGILKLETLSAQHKHSLKMARAEIAPYYHSVHIWSLHSFEEVRGILRLVKILRITYSLRMNVPMLRHLPILIVYIFLTPWLYWLGGVILRLEAVSARLTHSENDPMLRTPPVATFVRGLLRLGALSARLTQSENDPVLRTPPIGTLDRGLLRLGVLSVRLTQSENDPMLRITPIFIVYISTPEVPSLIRRVFWD